MAEQDKDSMGRFAAKGDSVRSVRTIRLTDETWAALGEKADNEDMSKADYLEALLAGSIDWDSDDSEPDQQRELDFEPEEVAELLKEALTFKANAGGRIKTKIKEALEMMGFNSSEED
jgi:hypothetical protein